MITLITPTCDRPHGIRLCQKWLKSQTYDGSVRWIVADGGRQSATIDLNRIGWTVHHLKTVAVEDKIQNFLTNVLAAMSLDVDYGERIFVVEDDDFYCANYLERSLQLATNNDLSGWTRNIYYHLPSRHFRPIRNTAHASFCHTSFSPRLLPWLRQAIRSLQSRNRFQIDLHMWRYAPGIPRLSDINPPLSIGIKGLGTTGIGVGHRPNSALTHWHPDLAGDRLLGWVGRDAWNEYLPFFGREAVI